MLGSLVEYLKGKGVQFTAKAYALLVFGYGRAKDEEKIEQILSWVKEEGIETDTVLFNSVLDAYIRCGSFPSSPSPLTHYLKKTK